MIARLDDPWFDAEFIGKVSPDSQSYSRIPSIDGAQGVFFWCPCGYGKPEFPLDGGRPHGCLVVFSNPRNAPEVPPGFGPHSRKDTKTHPRWHMSGSSIHDLSTEPSIAIGDPECWHGYLTNGEVT